MARCVMGLDLSTKMGLAIVEGTKSLLLANEYEFPQATGLERCGLLANVVIEACGEYHPEKIVIEGYSFASTHGLVYAVEIGTVVKFSLWQRDILYDDVSPGSLKKFVSGTGNANKDLMMLNVYKRWGIEPKTNNIADAVGLAMFGLCHVSGGLDFTKAQIECVAAHYQPKAAKTVAKKKKNHCS